MKISEVMSTGLAHVGHQDTIVTAAQKMAAEDVGSLPVVDGGKLVGVLTDRDIVVRGVAKGHDLNQPVASVMTTEVAALDAEDPVSAASDLMAEHKIRRVYVTTDGELVGVVALADIAKAVPAGDTGEALREISKD